MPPRKCSSEDLNKPCGELAPLVTADDTNATESTDLSRRGNSNGNGKVHFQQLTNTATCSCKPNCPRCKQKDKRKTCKYRQPERRSSFKPPCHNSLSTLKIDDNTTYRLSYLPSNSVPGEKFKPEDNLAVPEGKMSNDTVHNLSYTKYTNSVPAVPFVPCRHNLLGTGPIQDITTHKHDYVKKQIEKKQSYRPTENFISSDCPLSDKTTNRLSYPPRGIIAKVKPFRPVEKSEQQCTTMDLNTVHRMSYLPLEPQKPIDKPWVNKKPYTQPTLQMSGDSIYKQSYLGFVPDGPLESFKPKILYSAPALKMDDGTVYRRSYQGFESEKPKSFKPESALIKSEGKMSGDTINKLSYMPYKNALPATIFKPCQSTFRKNDPMQDITTHKHDYVCKSVDKRKSCRPAASFLSSDLPVSNKTVNRLSYVPHDLDKVRVQTAKLKEEIPKATGKVEGRTVHNMTYLPWEPLPKETFSWIPHKTFVRPQLCVDGNTTYSMSFALPGDYTECTPDDPDCIPCPETPSPCIPYGFEEPCCSDCCCQYPVAAC